MCAIKQTCEYIEEEAVIGCSDLLIRLSNNEHMRVRYAVLEAIGQLSIDPSPFYQEQSHRNVHSPLYHTHVGKK